MFHIPKRTNKLRWIVIFYALFVFVWSGRESMSIRTITLVSLGITILAMTSWILNRFGERTLSVRTGAIASTLIGAIIGLGTGVITATMMMFVNIRHAHIRPDFPPALIGAILQRIPAWTLAGALAGLALALMWIAVQPEPESHQQSQLGD